MAASDEVVAIWKQLDQAGVAGRLFEPDALQFVSAIPEFQELSRNVIGAGATAEVFGLLALRALAKHQDELAPRLADAELVATYPGSGTISARHTAQVVREMIQRARSELVIAGFAITEAGGLAQLLAEAAARSVRVVLLCGDWRPQDGPDTLELVAKGWPARLRPPEVFHYSDPTGGSQMHIKCVIADSAELLVGSANFTKAGMKHNFELGIRARGGLAKAARLLVDEFIRSGRFTKK
jgi:phosphatidylserine/phosphatidylglycerophosphate/cardiolipin synthase-like enzyme